MNVLTLSEFKAVMAHEFGHFAQQTGRVHAYTEVAMRVMQALKGGEDWVGREMKAAGRAAASGADSTLPLFFAVFVAAPVWCVSQLGGLLFYLVHVSRLSLSRSHEFHADRVAVSVAGSNAIVHGLARINFAEEALSEARRALEGAAEHNLYTRDLYFHHTTSAERLRRVQPRPVARAPAGPPVAGRGPARPSVRREGRRRAASSCGAPTPRNFDREENAKKVFVPAEEDDRSPWILFDDADDLRERVTRKFYRALFRVKKSARFRPPTEVQAFVDEEHPELAFDAKYRGAYDRRWIDPGRVSDLSQEVANDPWDAARLGQAHDRLYREIGRRAEDLRDLQARIREVYRKAYGRPRGRATRRLQDLEEDLADLVTWFKAFDRRAYLIHAQMAAQLGPRRLRELSDRYHFHLAVQAMHRNLVRATQQVEDALTGLFQESETELPSDFFQWVRDSCQAGRKTMLECVWRARELDPLEVPGVPSGVRFDRVIFDEKVLDEPPLQFIRGRWVVKLVRQMNRMRAGSAGWTSRAWRPFWKCRTGSRRSGPSRLPRTSCRWKTGRSRRPGPPEIPLGTASDFQHASRNSAGGRGGTGQARGSVTSSPGDGRADAGRAARV